MAAIQIVQSTTATLDIYPRALPSTAKVTIVKPGGSALVSQTTATIDSASTTVASVSAGTAGQQLSVASAAGLSVGTKYLLTSQDGQDATVEISEIDGTTIRLTDPPPFDPQDGDTLKGLRVSFSMSGAQTATRDLYYRAEWEITPSSGNPVRLQTIFHIVRMLFRDPVTQEDAKRILAFQFPSAAQRYEGESLANMAERASQSVLRQIEATGRLAHLYGDPGSFRDAGLVALRLVLADDGLIPQASTTDHVEYIEQLTKKLRDEIKLAVKAAQWYDDDDDRVVDARETGPWSTRVVM